MNPGQLSASLMEDPLFGALLRFLALLLGLPLTLAASEPLGILKGQVIDRQTGCPLAGASITQADAPDQVLGTTDSEGAFRLLLPPGSYDLRFKAQGHIAARWQAALAPGRVLAQDLSLDTLEDDNSIIIHGKRWHSMEETRQVLTQALATPTPTAKQVATEKQWKPVAQTSYLALQLMGLAMISVAVWGLLSHIG